MFDEKANVYSEKTFDFEKICSIKSVDKRTTVWYIVLVANERSY